MDLLENFHVNLLAMGPGGSFQDIANSLDGPASPAKNLALIPGCKTHPQPNALTVEGAFGIYEEQRRVI